MNLRQNWRTLSQGLLLGAVVGGICGLASAVFLILLEHATKFRTTHEWLVYTLPVAGLIIGAIYDRWGKTIRGGNNLILDTLHDGSAQIPARMSVMVLIGTVLTHLFGGSAGREGTAVQMGGSLADEVAHRLKVSPSTRRQLLAAGIAGGFGSVFGTPIAGTIFGLEVVCIGTVEYDALLPALVAAVIGDLVTRGVGVVHTPYPTVAPLALDAVLLVKWLICGVAMAGASVAFIELTHAIENLQEIGRTQRPRGPGFEAALERALGALRSRARGTAEARHSPRALHGAPGSTRSPPRHARAGREEPRQAPPRRSNIVPPLP